MEGEGVGGGRGTKSLRFAICHPRKELKDPDQLYTTLKNLLAQIKVGRPGSLLGLLCQWLWLHDPLWVGDSHMLGVGDSHKLGVGHSGPGCSSALLSSHTPVPGPSWSR